MDVHLGPPWMEWMEMDAKSGPVEWMAVEMEMRGRYKGTVHVILPPFASRASAKLISANRSVPGTFTSSRSLSVLLIYPPQCHDLTVCVIPIVLASSLARSSRTIRPHVEKSLSTSADIGRTESTSRAICDRRGYSSRFSYQ